MLCDNQFCLATMTLYLATPFPLRSAMLVQARYCIHCGRQVSAVWTQSGESGNTLKNQVQWYGRRESKHLRSAYNDRSRVHQPMFGERHNALLLLSKPPQRRPKRSGSPRLWLTPPQKKAPEASPRQCVINLCS